MAGQRPLPGHRYGRQRVPLTFSGTLRVPIWAGRATGAGLDRCGAEVGGPTDAPARTCATPAATAAAAPGCPATRTGSLAHGYAVGLFTKTQAPAVVRLSGPS